MLDVRGTAPRAAAALLLGALAACGGGGGGGGDGGNAVDFSVSTTTLSFSGVDGVAPAAQSVIATALNGLVFFDVQASGPIGITKTTAGAAMTINVQVGALSPGTYTGTITIKGFRDPLGSIPVGSPKTVGVTYTVISGIRGAPSSLSFERISGSAEPAAQTISLTDTLSQSYAWNASVAYTTGSGWLTLSATSGPSLPASIDVGIQSGALPLGTYEATIQLTAAGGRTSQVFVSFTYRAPALTPSPGSLTFEAIRGGSNPPGQTVTLAGENIPWTATANQPWVMLSPAGGTGPGTFSVTPDIAGLLPGVNTATVNVAAGGGTQPVVVTLNLEPRRLAVSSDGVGFASTASISSLSRTLTVSENAGSVANWNASSSETWLTVTPSGTTPGSLTLIADPTGLTAEQTYFATVTVSSPDATISNTETIRVGFYVSALTPSTTSSMTFASGATLIADPIRPLVYVGSKFACSGAPGGSDIAVFNVHTGTQVATLTVPGAQLGEMAVASDGSKLYVINAAIGAIVPVDLATLTPGTALSTLSSYNAGCQNLAWTRANGRGLLLTGKKEIIDGSSVSQFSDSSPGTGLILMAPSGDGASLYGLEFSASNGPLLRYAVKYSFATSQATVARTHSAGDFNTSSGLDLAVNTSGSRVFVATPTNFPTNGVYTFDGTTLAGTSQHPGSNLAFVANVEMGPTGKLYTGEGSDNPPGFDDLFIFDNLGGVQQGSLNLPLAGLRGQLVVSGDGLRVIQLGFATFGGSPPFPVSIGFATTSP